MTDNIAADEVLPDHGLRALVADDDPVTAAVLTVSLQRWGFRVTTVHDGDAAWAVLSGTPAPEVAILDWMMPGVDGPTLCARLREDEGGGAVYVILLTSRDAPGDLVTGLEAGADEYLIKPFNVNELRARVRTGMRMLTLQRSLSTKVAALEDALANVKRLRGLLPVCSYCRRIRTDEDSWQQIEVYVSEHSEAEFSHGICPSCLVRVQKEYDL